MDNLTLDIEHHCYWLSDTEKVFIPKPKDDSLEESIKYLKQIEKLVPPAAKAMRRALEFLEMPFESHQALYQAEQKC